MSLRNLKGLKVTLQFNRAPRTCKKNLDELEKLESLDEDDKSQDDIDIATAYEFFTTKFMQKHTRNRYSDFRKLMADGGFTVKTVRDIQAVPADQLDRHISKSTDFPSWGEMQDTGMMEYIDENL